MKPRGRSPDRLLTYPFVMLALADLGYFTAVGVAIYTLPLFVTGPLGSDETGAGVAFGAFGVSALLLRPFAGRLSDRWGRRPLLVGGATLAVAGLALTVAADSLAQVVVLRLVLGVAEAAFFVASFAALADLAPPARLGEAVSYNSLGLYLGLACGPPLGELLVEHSGYGAAWWGAAGLAAAGTVVVLGVGETRLTDEDPGVSQQLIHRPTIPIALGFVTSLIAIGGYLSLSALRAEDVGLEVTSLPLFAYGMVVVGCRIAFAKVPDRLPPLVLGASALVAIAGGLVVIAAVSTPLGIMAGSVTLAVGVAFSTPAFFSAIFVRARPSERGAASGTASAAIDLGLGLGPIALGFVAATAGLSGALLAGAAVSLMGALWTLRLRSAPTVG